MLISPDPPPILPRLGVALAVFVLALLLRIANLPTAFSGGIPQFSPFDDLYHAKRIAYSAEHPFQVLGFDPNRRVSGAFCPWPPLYDMLAGAGARMLGGDTAIGALSRAAWFPPIVASLCAALIAAVLSRRHGLATGLLAGAAVAVSVYWLDKSRLAAIDHHFLEFPLVLAIAAAVSRGERADDLRSAFSEGAILAAALLAALLVQPALLLAAAAAAGAALLFPRQRRPARAAVALGFAAASGVLFFYRAIQPPGYPDNEWHLGLPHAAALLAAAVACATQLAASDRGVRKLPGLLLAAGAGALTLVSVPRAFEGLVGGSRFLGGDPWFESISEFHPLFFGPESIWFLDLMLLGGGALLTAAAIFDRAWHSGPRRGWLLFAVAYLVAAVSSMRFLVVAAPLAAVTGAVVVSDLHRRGSRALASAAGVLLIVPSLALALGRAYRPAPAVGPEAVPVVRAMEAIGRESGRPGRILGPWSWGHLFNVVGNRGVLLDNFGTMNDPVEFMNATAAVFVTREQALAEYCRANGVRFVILDDPLPFFSARARMSGFPRSAYEDEPGSPTKLMKATFWWRGYFEGGRERPGRGSAGSAFRFFRLVRVETGPEPRSAVQIWEYRREGP